MIWTLICFAITFFVLKRYAFGPIQKTIDERRDRIRAGGRRGRQRPRRGARAARAAPAAPRPGQAESAEILAEARKVADAQIARAKEEAEAERQRRLEETQRQIEAETTRALDQIRTEVADLTLEATEARRRQGARRRRPAPADRRGDRRARLLGAGERKALDGRRAAHVRARALRGRAGGRAASTSVARRARASSPARSTSVARARGVPRATRSSTRPRRPTCSARSRPAPTPLVRNFVRLVAEKGRAGELAAIAEEFDALVDAGAGPARRRADDRLRALRRRRPRRSSRTIEKASGRTVEATRTVDPEPHRRHRPPGRLAPRRRQRPRPARAPPPRPRATGPETDSETTRRRLAP